MKKSTMNDENWQRVGELVALRRGELGLKRQDDAAAKAEIGVTKWREIEAGKSGKPVMLAAVARALGWPADALQRIAQGDESFLERSALETRVDVIEDRLDRVETKIDALLDDEPAP